MHDLRQYVSNYALIVKYILLFIINIHIRVLVFIIYVAQLCENHMKTSW